jgi:ribosome-associated translation inhibitor RaiA
MGPPIEIDFRGMPPAQHVRDTIAKHLSELETRFGRITGGNVVLMSPGAHYRSGGPYEVTIHLLLPDGHEVNVGRTSSADERHADVEFAVNDAFKRARRQLQDRIRRITRRGGLRPV